MDALTCTRRARPILFSGAMVRALLAGTKTQTRRIVKPQPHHGPVGEMVHLGDGGWAMDDGDLSGHWQCPYGVPGDLLWVRERCRTYEASDGRRESRYFVDGDTGRLPDGFGHWDSKPRVSIHMPRWASRLTLEITDVRVERLQDISEADAIAEGLYRSKPDDEDREWFGPWHEENTGEPPTQADWDQFNQGVWMVPGVPQGWGMTKADRQRDTWGPTPQFCYRLLWEHINGKDSWTANPWVWAVSFKVHQQNVDAFFAEVAA